MLISTSLPPRYSCSSPAAGYTTREVPPTIRRSASFIKRAAFSSVIEIPDDIEKITEEVLKTKRIWAGEILLLKTKNSFSDGFSDDFAYLAASGAVYLAGEGARAVGTDGLGIERAQEGHPTHKILLGHGIPVIEGLRLADVPEGDYELLCLPLRIAGVEALPARAVLYPLKENQPKYKKTTCR